MFDKVYELSLSRNYVSRWGCAEAIRELIQNALDSASPFVYEFRAQDDGTTQLMLRSAMSSLKPQTLLLGASGKGNDPDAIGSFGEGYKLALLVLTRLGYPVVLLNDAVEWRPRFQHSRKFDEELLVVEETNASDRSHSGLTVIVDNLTADDVAALIDSCLLMQPRRDEIKVTTRGDILLERPGMLYVGYLFICKIDAKFGYNIHPKFIKLERDRQTVSTFDLYDVTRDMWYETKEFDRIAEMIEAGIPDLQYAQYSAPELVKQACYELFRKNNPGAVMAETQAELKQLVAQGMQRVVYVNASMSYAVRNSSGYRREAPIRIVAPHERLAAFFASHKFRMHETVKREFGALIEEAKSWRLK